METLEEKLKEMEQLKAEAEKSTADRKALESAVDNAKSEAEKAKALKALYAFLK